VSDFITFMSTRNRFVTWWPDAPHLDGDDDLVAAVERAIAEHDEQTIGLTPTGPFVRVSINDPLGVLAAIAAAGLSLQIIGQRPDGLPDDLPADAVG